MSAIIIIILLENVVSRRNRIQRSDLECPSPKRAKFAAGLTLVRRVVTFARVPLQVGLAGDVWALGCVLWEAGTGDSLPLGDGPSVVGRVALTWDLDNEVAFIILM